MLFGGRNMYVLSSLKLPGGVHSAFDQMREATTHQRPIGHTLTTDICHCETNDHDRSVITRSVALKYPDIRACTTAIYRCSRVNQHPPVDSRPCRFDELECSFSEPKRKATKVKPNARRLTRLHPFHFHSSSALSRPLYILAYIWFVVPSLILLSDQLYCRTHS
jgi:hypothetical protein